MKIAIIDESPSRGAVIEEGLEQSDAVVQRFTSRTGLAAALVAFDPDVVLMNLGNPGRDELEEMFQVSRALARPIAMFVDQSDADAMAAAVDAGVGAYVVDGLRADRVKTVLDLAIRRYSAFSRLQDELREAKDALADRNTIDRAKRLLMTRRGLDEPEAYKLLRDQAMRTNRRIVEIAEALVTAEDLLGGGGL